MSDDRIVFAPDDVDLRRSPLRRGIAEPTYVLGAFNPALTRLPGGNLLLLVRIAEALVEPVRDGKVRSIRWTPGGYTLDSFDAGAADVSDPRFFSLKGGAYPFLGLTSLSWLLPVELSGDGTRVVAVHYDRAVEPSADYAQYGIEDPRIVAIDGRYWMTVCGVSGGRLCTVLYRSADGFDWTSEGIVLDHGNKDMVPFEGRVGERYATLTRPLSDAWFVPAPDGMEASGPSINLATSPDMLHWKPLAGPALRPLKGSAAYKLGGGTPPVRVRDGWMMLYHGVEKQGAVGVYRTYRALLSPDAREVLERDETRPVLEAAPALIAPIAHQAYLPQPVVFTTGIVRDDDDWIVASGEADLACRLTRVSGRLLR
ncbi:glycosidase [Sphingomonas sp. Leaf25]|uniref:glycoside hydrolase family 130 protein n=1 Tax=Sphingomonas sp. Leaf25 TaxID=1735692 RepID=UPI0006F5FA9D|nr:glycosidase [Sphingomonas sp. Leaf25]KQN07650.1 glycosidase [Sphingomonas sp. Leaf25]